MGYYTNFDASNNSDEVITTLQEISGYSGWYQGSLDSAKWYSWKEHLKEASLKHPDTLITLSGEGEENGDIWQAYAKNGKLQVSKATITFEPFDESKLK